MSKLYKIGEFAKVVDTTIQALRYYNDIELLIPSDVDKFTNYRYYSEDNVVEYYVIKLLKEVGFTLDEIKEYKNKLSDEVILNKKESLMQEINNIKRQIKALDKIRLNIKEGQLVVEPTKQISTQVEIKTKTKEK